MKLREDEYIRNTMNDEISLKLYRNRIAYAEGDCNAIEAIMLSAKYGGAKLGAFMEAHRNNLYIFGAGNWGKDFVNTWRWKYKFKAFFDNNSVLWNEAYEGIPIVPFAKDTISPNIAIIVISKLHETEILEQLEKFQIPEEHIFLIGKYQQELVRGQYFDLENLVLSQNERFVDCGALDGSTSLNLLRYCDNKVNKIWMFEPDGNNVKKVERAFAKEAVDYTIMQKGVWSCETKLHFDSRGNGCACVSLDGNEIIDTVKLDDILADENPTFIKMDIEGAELEALHGAEQTIKVYKPKLAISVYHRLKDINDLPEIILGYNPRYKFYLRHYSLLSTSETVLYAI